MPAQKPPVWRSPRDLIRTLLMLDDTHHSIAMGVTIGMFIGMTPTVGIQMILVLLFGATFGRWIRFNISAALVTVYISNPLTVVPIYWFDYKVGTYFVGGSASLEHFKQALQYHDFASWLSTITYLFIDVGSPLILGSLIIAVCLAAATYPATRWLLRSFKPEGPPPPVPDDSEPISSQATPS